ncbi:MAG TPA: hypothetical protein VJS44_18430 [Pyrinomonadaceae bacterium]|nr:hypothetical protein [Pyrinomonadaceae bacterium]
MEATFWLARRLPPCTELLPIISQALEREWTLRERVVMRLHFLYCDFCERYLKQLRFMREAARTGADKIYEAPSPVTPALSTEARNRLKSALRSGSE